MFTWWCEMVQRHKIFAVIYINFAQSCKIFAWSCKLGQRLIYHIFQAMKTPLFLAWFLCFCMSMQNGDGPLKLFFPLLHAFHPSEKSFKTQIKELRWIYLMETKRKNQNSKESREMRNHWASQPLTWLSPLTFASILNLDMTCKQWMDQLLGT